MCMKCAIAGKLQRAAVDAPASDWGSGVQWASGLGRSLRLVPGADVPGGCLFCLFLLHHSPSHSQAFQPSAGGDLWAGSAGWVWLSLHLWAGKESLNYCVYASLITFYKQWRGEQTPNILCLYWLYWHQLIQFTFRLVITHQLLPTMWRHSEDGPCGSISLLTANFVGNIFQWCR